MTLFVDPARDPFPPRRSWQSTFWMAMLYLTLLSLLGAALFMVYVIARAS